ncbi:MAG: hypothetical protein QOJ90_218 [Actinomycetota bacterium]|jgi:RimJ/RimL family protein N-acetyltransferase|nr:hypothetical protein [Actinomycetota bacterium]MDQ1640867.1 hypothetical protein [Actinomycetota bacterium]
MIPRPVPTIEAEGLLLTPLSDSDAAAVVALSDDPETRAWSSLKTVRSPADAEAWIRERLARSDGMTWAVRDTDTGQLVARVGLVRIDEADRAAEVGYSVRADHRRNGIATRAVRGAASYGFAELGLARIILQHATGNRASCAVARTTGFAYEGTARALFDNGKGVRHDYHIHARLADDPAGRVPAPRAIEPVEIGAGRLQLVPWRPADAPDVDRAFVEPHIARWDGGPPWAGIADADRWLAARTTGWESGAMVSWSVRDSTTGRLLGSVAIKDLDRRPGTGVASYWVRAAERGHGVAGQALGAAARFSYAVLGLHRIEAYHAVANTASCRVAVRSGFPLEGLLRGSLRLADGVTDEHLHAQLATDAP